MSEYPTEMPDPPKPDEPVSFEAPKKHWSEKLLSGILAAAPIVGLLGLVAVIVFAVATGPVSQDYSKPSPTAVSGVVTQEQVQAHVEEVLGLVVRGQQQEASVVAQEFVAALEAEGCATMGDAGLAPNARAAGTAMDATIERAQTTIPEGMVGPFIGSTVMDWPATENPRDVGFLVVAVACKADA